MSSQSHGTGTSTIEVTDISPQGIWVLAGDEEIFLPFETFPWFKSARVESILKVEEQAPGHYHWPDLDIDLDLDTMRHPERYPRTFA